MNNRVVKVPAIKTPITPSPGFAKKELADFKLDLLGLCEFGCLYCSSNHGNYLRIHKEEFAETAKKQLGERLVPSENPDLTIQWPDVLEKLEAQLEGKSKMFGLGKTLMFSMLTDGFSPSLVQAGTTEAALKMVLEQTGFRIRVLTKNAVIGTDRWIKFFRDYPGRFVVGLSIGSLDDNWARKVEIGTSIPAARFRALQRLQDAGVPTFGMLCPVFPDVLEGGTLEKLVEQVRPDLVEHLWAEPFNDRANWKKVRDGYQPGSIGHNWLTDAYGNGQRGLWSKYATDLYLRLRAVAEAGGWLQKMRYLLYEDQIAGTDARRFPDLSGVLLQSKPDESGYSKNSGISALQVRMG